MHRRRTLWDLIVAKKLVIALKYRRSGPGKRGERESKQSLEKRSVQWRRRHQCHSVRPQMSIWPRVKCSRTSQSVSPAEAFGLSLLSRRIGSVVHRADGIFHSENLVNSASLAVLLPSFFGHHQQTGLTRDGQCRIAKEGDAAFFAFFPNLSEGQLEFGKESTAQVESRTDSHCIPLVRMRRPQKNGRAVTFTSIRGAETIWRAEADATLPHRRCIVDSDICDILQQTRKCEMGSWYCKTQMHSTAGFFICMDSYIASFLF